MRNKIAALAAAALTMGSVVLAASAQAAESTPNTPTVPSRPGPSVQLLDCQGTTGDHGCGPGWFWRNGDRGWACYPCN